jgi:hypothetical protein
MKKAKFIGLRVEENIYNEIRTLAELYSGGKYAMIVTKAIIYALRKPEEIFSMTATNCLNREMTLLKDNVIEDTANEMENLKKKYIEKFNEEIGKIYRNISQGRNT